MGRKKRDLLYAFSPVLWAALAVKLSSRIMERLSLVSVVVSLKKIIGDTM